jgi:hypothetical protein
MSVQLNATECLSNIKECAELKNCFVKQCVKQIINQFAEDLNLIKIFVKLFVKDAKKKKCNLVEDLKSFGLNIFLVDSAVVLINMILFVEQMGNLIIMLVT